MVFIIERVKSFYCPETLHFLNLYEVLNKNRVFFSLLQYFIAYGEFREADKVL